MTTRIRVLALVAFVLIVTLSTEPPACAKRMAAQGVAGLCIGG